jgi:hypothetical protein
MYRDYVVALMATALKIRYPWSFEECARLANELFDMVKKGNK